MKKYMKLIKITTVVLVLSLILWLYLFAFSLKASKNLSSNLQEFSFGYDEAEANGFVDANNLSNKNKLITKSGNYELYLDETTSHFYVKNVVTNEIIESNPRGEDPEGVSETVLSRQKSTIEYAYYNEDGSRSSKQNNYSKSIYHDETVEYSAGRKTYKIKELENGFQVYYKVTDLNIDYLYFPMYLTPEQVAPIIEKGGMDSLYLFNIYSDTLDSETGLHKAKVYKNMTNIGMKRLYDMFYVRKLFGEYTRERAIEENAQNGYYETVIRFGFDVAVQVVLENNEIEIKVINNSITEYSNSKLAELTLYPYFGTAIDIDPVSLTENEGYMVIPDGSGAILEFNNGKIAERSYSKRVYGADMSYLPYEMSEEQEKISIPVFGMVKEKIGYATIIHEGDGLATINANVSNSGGDAYNRINVTFRMRENELSIIGSGWNKHEINIWTKDLVRTDITLKYVLLEGQENNYVGVANAYKNYLVEEFGLELNQNIDKKLVLELLGAYDSRKMFLGVPYTSMSSLTNYKQAEIIVDELNKFGVNNLDIIFSGITNGGLNNNLETKVKFEKTVGNKKAFNKFDKSMSDKGINVYPTANFFSADKFNKPLENSRYSSNRVKGDRSVIFNYNIPTRLPYSETQYDSSNDHTVINPKYYEALYNKYDKSYSFDNLMLDGIGSNLAGSYKKKNVIYLNESILYQKQIIEKVSHDKNLALSNPFGFTFPNLTLATDLPMESTLYTVLDYRIPLLQLVLSGVVDYSHSSINLASKRDVDYQFLKALENGSSLKYTLSYKSSLELLGTNHNQYMSTEYKNWLETIEDHNNVIKNNGLDKANLVGHERIQNNVFKSTYSNGTYIITNYNLNVVTVDGINIPSIGYYIKGGGN